jgi:hypothetical protein
MRIGQPLEAAIGAHERVLDAWEAGGVRGLVVGRMAFMPSPAAGDRAEAVPAFEPNRSVYRRLDVEPPPSPDRSFPDERRQLDAMLDAAKRRGWSVLIFEPAAFRAPEGGRHLLLDDAAQRAYLARAQDTLEAFPQADGAVIDGPEWPYEIAWDPRSLGPYVLPRFADRATLFADLPEGAETVAGRLGYDAGALRQAPKRLERRLHELSDSDVERDATGGVFGGLGLIGYDGSVVDWLRFRMDVLTGFVERVKGHLAGLGPPRALGMGPRTATFAPLAGYDFARLGRRLDYFMPKHYFWQRGYDGMYGTWARSLRALMSWNPGLSERGAFRAVEALWGIGVSGVESLSAIGDGFPPAFFSHYVADQTRRAIAATGDARRVVPWVDVGRLPHDGDPIGAGDLRRILTAAADAGLERFLYHNHAHLGPSEWLVISELCGQPWPGAAEDGSGYRPPDGFHLHPAAF